VLADTCSFGSPAVFFSRPVAFRALLAKSSALSGMDHNSSMMPGIGSVNRQLVAHSDRKIQVKRIEPVSKVHRPSSLCSLVDHGQERAGHVRSEEISQMTMQAFR